MKREQLKAEEFSYDLPQVKIAKHPLEDRNQSKLLVYCQGEIGEDRFSNLNTYLPKGSTLVFNDTKVIAARLYFQKKTGAKIQIFCLEPFESTVEQALGATASCQWQCMVGNLKRFKDKDVLELEIAGTLLCANLVQKRDNDVIVQFSWDGDIAFSSILEKAGEIPLPPYLNRATEERDEESYQTVYAQNKGAVAAPTAGLHFVTDQLSSLQQEGHNLAYLTLFVGAGTFRAVKSDHLVDHDMHQERIVVTKATLQKLLGTSGRIVSVGTTSLRSLESLYWLAVKIHSNSDLDERFLSQEDAYSLPSKWSWKEAFEYVLQLMDDLGKEKIDFHSALFIMPGYEFKVIDGLITNFHQPKSTLLALVCAWIGEDWKAVYHYALANDFRFLSYGDSSILLR